MHGACVHLGYCNFMSIYTALVFIPSATQVAAGTGFAF